VESIAIPEGEERVVTRRHTGKLRRALAILVVGTIVGGVVAEAGVAWADTFRVRAYRTDSGAWRWRPKHRYITNGDHIRWTNPTSRRHNVTAYGGNWSYSRVLDPGEAVRRQFNTDGNFRYRCTIHSSLVDGVCSGQCGIIHVT
jgi:plastocyanin